MINRGPLPLGPHSSMLFEYYYLWKGSKIIEGKKKEPLYEPLSQKYWGKGGGGDQIGNLYNFFIKVSEKHPLFLAIF